MSKRAMMLGLLLIAIHPGGGSAQGTAPNIPAPSINSNPTENPIAADGTSKVPNNVPEIINRPGEPGVKPPNAAAAPR